MFSEPFCKRFRQEPVQETHTHRFILQMGQILPSKPTTEQRLLVPTTSHLKRKNITLDKHYKYPLWALNRANIKQKKTNRPNQDASNARNNTGFNSNKPSMVVHFRGGSTIMALLVHAKDKDTIP